MLIQRPPADRSISTNFPMNPIYYYMSVSVMIQYALTLCCKFDFKAFFVKTTLITKLKIYAKEILDQVDEPGDAQQANKHTHMQTLYFNCIFQGGIIF